MRKGSLVWVWGGWYKVLADKDEVNKNEAESHITAGFMTLTLQNGFNKLIFGNNLRILIKTLATIRFGHCVSKAKF